MNTFELPSFITAESKYEDEHSARRLSRLAKSGALIRVRRGLYLPADVWSSLTPWHKYRVKIQSVHETAVGKPVFARESAAQIIGLPLIGTPKDVQTIVPRGRIGGQSSNGVHRLNGIDRDPKPWEMFGLLVTPPVQTARDMAVRLPLTKSLAAMDRLLQGKVFPGSPPQMNLTFTEQHVIDSVALLPNETQRGRVMRVLEAANGLSQSAGESLSRAFMILNGFPRPTLQVEFRDGRGRIGFPDFDWEEYKTLGEFDGYEKYSAQKYLKGKTPSEVVVEEKNRENRLRALGYNVVRWTWDDLKYPQRLIALLHEAGLPSK
ncbi:hypothetical protein [Arthrobacter sp. TWP1-1]|uniref:hypothetical protein n=1 Tax=Arthrobacter sp. TWP1-1 TaxID=2804568 RepID=UPI003CE7869E